MNTAPIRQFAAVLAALAATLAVAGPLTHPGADEFVRRAVEEFGFERGEVEAVLADASYQQSIVDAMTRPAEAKPWYLYRPIFLTEQRISGGVEFWREHRELISRAAEHFGVDPQVIVAIIGVETFYGRITGSYRVIDALVTLGFYYPSELKRDRSDFFSDQLLEFMTLAREENLPLRDVTGSYAGAMGMGQFIPSSYRAYAVDFDDDGSRDLWRSTEDVVGSVANYLSRHGWRPGEPVAMRAVTNGAADPDYLARGNYKPTRTVAEAAEHGYLSSPELDPERLAAVVELEEEGRKIYWLTFDNFHVITRYNRSALYAMAVQQLGEEIAARMAGA